MTDRRVWFFLLSALLCAALVPVANPKFRWVAETAAVVYVVLAVAVALDARSRGRGRRKR